MFDCWKGRRRVKSLWSKYEERLGECGGEEENGRSSATAPNSPQHRLSMATSSLKCLVSAFSKQCLSHDQLEMLSRAAEDEAGECLVLPQQVHLTRSHSSVCPLVLLGQVLRGWSDLKSTKDLHRLVHLCDQPANRVVRTMVAPPLEVTAMVAPPQEVTPSHKKAQFDQRQMQCCNPFHWSRQVHQEQTSLPDEPTKKSLLSLLQTTMQQDPSDYHSVDTESVKEQSVVFTDRCSSTETGISRLCGGQISAGSTTARDGDLPCDYPGAKQYCPEQYKARSHHWCMVRYWEEKVPLGSGPYKVVQPIFNVSQAAVRRQAGEGMSLAAIDNGQRSPRTEALRQKVGLGLTLILDQDEGTVKIYNRSKLSLFVSSRYLDALHAGGAAAVVGPLRRPVKLPPGWLVNAADLHLFPGPPDAGAVSSHIFDSISVSFGKGWGPGYYRTSIRECNCWLEISLDGLPRPK